MSNQLNTRLEKINRLTEGLAGEYILVHLNTKKSTILSLPQHLLEPSTITLKLSYYFEGSMQLDNDQIEANLRFGEDYFTCVIPYDCIWGVTTEKGQNTIWSEDIPADLLKNQSEPQPMSINNASDLKTKTPSKKKKASKKEATKRPNHLKRIK